MSQWLRGLLISDVVESLAFIFDKNYFRGIHFQLVLWNVINHNKVLGRGASFVFAS